MLANRGMKVAFADMLFEKFGLMAETASLLRESHDVLFQPVDVTDSESVIALLDRTERHFGEPPSLVVHCAGITASQPLFEKSSKEVHSLALFDRLMNVNASGTFNLSRLVAQRMLSLEPDASGQRGLIITTSSMTGFEGGAAQIAYSTSKAAVIGMTLPFARALGDYGIRYNSIAPGMFYTPMLRGYEEAAEALEEMIPFPRRLGTPEDFTRVVSCIMECPMLNGAVIRVDGGLRM